MPLNLDTYRGSSEQWCRKPKKRFLRQRQQACTENKEHVGPLLRPFYQLLEF